MKRLTHQTYMLFPPGGLFDDSVVRNLFPDLSQGARNILVHRAIESGEIQRLKRGLYLLDKAFRKTTPPPFAVAPMLYSPSYISFESALSFHGLIPEAIFQTTSATTKRSRQFPTPLGEFTFHTVPTSDPLAGVEFIPLGSPFWGAIATPFRAIADLVYLRKEVEWSRDGIRFLTDSLRIEYEDLRSLSLNRSNEIIQGIQNKRTVNYMLNLKKELNP